MRYATPLITLLIATMSFGANAVSIEGAMDCTVKSHRVHTITDGSPKTFGSIRGGFKVDDVLRFYYRFDTISKGFELNLRDNHRSGYLLMNTFGRHQIVNAKNKGEYSSVFGDANVSLTNQNLYFVSQKGSLDLSRYYKSDWNGLLTLSKRSEYVAVSALDCRSENDKFEEFVEGINSVK
jgi:hypothetical protein